MVKKDHDLEKEWKKLRGKIQFKLDDDEGLVEDIKEEEQEIRSEQFTDFLQKGEFKVPVLERVESAPQQEQTPNLEEAGLPEAKNLEPDFTPKTVVENQPQYIPEKETFYREIVLDTRPAATVPSEPIFPQDVVRTEFLNPTHSVSGMGLRESIYPEVLQERKDDDDSDKKDYYQANQ